MTTYTLVIERTAIDLCEAKAYSTAANAIDELELWRAAGAAVPAILRDGQPISEAMLREEEVVRAIDVEGGSTAPSAAAGVAFAAAHAEVAAA